MGFDVKPGQNVIALSIWDKNTIKKDVFMGYSFVAFDDCRQGQSSSKTVPMLGGCSGEINLVVTPDFETSVSAIENLTSQVQQGSSNNAKSQEEISRLSAE